MALTANSSQSGSRSTAVLAVVILLHVGLFYAIQSGLSRKMIELLPQDIQTKIIEEEKPKEELPPPPPPPDIPIEPPPFVPPPEVSIQTPVATNAIQNVVTVPPPAPPPPAAPPRQAVVSAPKVDPRKSRSCDEYYPAASSRAGEEGVVQVRCLVGLNGKCGEISVAKSSGIERLDQAAERCAKDLLRFVPQSKDGVAEATWYDFNVRFQVKK